MYGLSKKKMPYLYPIDEAIGLLNNEIRLGMAYQVPGAIQITL